jgi:hypothetical protein
MPFGEMVMGQLLDPFRIGLLVALFATMWRTRVASGVWIPLAAGIVFVAVIIPVAMTGAALTQAWPAIVSGLVSNTALLVVIAVLWTAYRRLAGSSAGS